MQRMERIWEGGLNFKAQNQMTKILIENHSVISSRYTKELPKFHPTLALRPARCNVLTDTLHRQRKIKLSPLQAVEAYKVVRC
jgi:hypothetical protein